MELYHHGIKGQKWGVRRYQNKDGSLTELGKARYSKPVDANNMPRKQWLKLVDSGRDFVVSKGQEAYRSTTTEYEIEAGKNTLALELQILAYMNSLLKIMVAPIMLFTQRKII